MNRSIGVAVVTVAMISAASAQLASHASTIQPQPASISSTVQVKDKPVVRVNGVVLTDRDLLREMYSMFPYARQHGGKFPQQLEPDIRRGAIEMIVFEELVYQEAQRRKLSIPATRLDAAVAKLRAQFTPEDYRGYLKNEWRGSQDVLREKIRRSMLIDAVMKSDVESKAVITPAAAQAYYNANRAEFQRAESFAIQTISIIPPQNGGADVAKQTRVRADEALRLAKKTNTYRDFGLLAEKLSDDDWHVNMGDRRNVAAAALPPAIAQAARAMQPGQVSDLIQLGPNYTLFRLNTKTLPGTAPFAEVKAALISRLQTAKVNELRSALNRRLHTNAKIQAM